MAVIIEPTSIDDGQFDDAPENLQDARTPHAYIDTYDSKNDNDDLDWSDSSKDEYESEEIDETYDDNRVEDEDWENAERGKLLSTFFFLFYYYYQVACPNKKSIFKISQNNIITFDNMSPCAQAMLKEFQKLINSL